MTAIYAFALLYTLESMAKNAGATTERYLRTVELQYDLVFASIEDADTLTELVQGKGNGNLGIGQLVETARDSYERIMDYDDENLIKDEEIDTGLNKLEKDLGTIRRQILLFARVNNVFTSADVKEFFGKFRGSFAPGGVPDPDSGVDRYRR
jgi:hypothetical protein